MSRRNSFIDLRHYDVWRGVCISSEDARDILSAIRWPHGKLAGLGSAVEVSEGHVSIYELVGATQIAHKRRRGKLLRKHKLALRATLHHTLGIKRFSNSAFEDLFRRLGI